MPSAWLEKHKKTGRYYVRWRNPTGVLPRHPSLPCGADRAKALVALSDKIEELEKGIKPQEEKPAEDLLKTYHTENVQILEEATRGLVDEHIPRFFREYGIKESNDVTTDIVRQWRADMFKKGLAPGTVSIRLRTLRAFLNKNFIQGVSFKGLIPKCKSAGRYLEHRERAKLSSVLGWAIQQVWVFAMNTAMRPGELWRASRNYLEGRYLKIPKTKNSNPRKIYLNDPAWHVINQFPRNGTDRIFSNWSTVKSMQDTFYRDSRKAKIGEVSLYDARHNWTTDFLRKGGSISGAMAIRGDRSIKSLEPYLHEMPGHLKEDSKIVTIAIYDKK